MYHNKTKARWVKKNTALVNEWLQTNEPSIEKKPNKANAARQRDKFYRSGTWRKRRQMIFEAFGEACEICGSGEEVHVHHNNYSTKGKERNKDLIILCKECHHLFHSQSYANHHRADLFEDGFRPTPICSTCAVRGEYLVEKDCATEIRRAKKERQLLIASRTGYTPPIVRTCPLCDMGQLHQRNIIFCPACIKMFKHKLGNIRIKEIFTGTTRSLTLPNKPSVHKRKKDKK